MFVDLVAIPQRDLITGDLLKQCCLELFFFKAMLSRAASCPGVGQTCGWDFYYSDNDNEHELKGALVGGPNQQDEWTDDRTNYAVKNLK